MKTKQTIAILGATGNMGSALAKSLAKGNYRLLLYATDRVKADEIISEINIHHPTADVEVIDCSKEACWEADAIIAAVPFSAEKAIADKIKEVANQKIVISISNPFNDSFEGLVTAPGTSAAEELQQLLPYAKVVKAFNTTFASDFSNPAIAGLQVDSFIAGNDQEALETVSEMVSIAGFNPVIAGDLSASRILEGMQLLMIQLNARYHYNRIAGWKILHN